MANRFERVDNTAPVVDVAENEKPNVEWSTFDENCKMVGQALPYAIIPIDVIETLVGSKTYLNYDVEVQFRNPTQRKMLNGFRVYLHSWYNRKSDLWEGWENFITKGRSGSINLKIPHIQTRINAMGSPYTPFTPMSLYDYLGYAPENFEELNKYCGVTPAKTTTNKTGLADYSNIEITALKPMMYQKLWVDKYAPKNLLQSNKNIYPDNRQHFILSYNANVVGRVKYEDEEIKSMGTQPGFKDAYVGNNGSVDVRLDCLRFRQFTGDRFTTASPFEDMLRGDKPKLNLTLNGSDLSVTIPELKIRTKTSPEMTTYELKTTGRNVLPDWETGESLAKVVNTVTTSSPIGEPVYTPSINVNLDDTEITSQITLSQLRSLEVFTLFAERMARTNGDYNEMIKAHFGRSPNSTDREAIYIGGSYQDILQNSIFQTSESTNESMLGRQVSTGISAAYNKIGEFEAPDHGYIMTVMMIVPDTVYVQGVHKNDTALTVEEQYYPIFNNLSAEAILNKELFVSGDATVDNDIFGNAERFSEWKSRRSRVCGFSQLKNDQDEYDSALVMARRFSETPNLNAEFVTGYPDNVSLASFAAEDEPPFDFVIRKDVTINHPMPYVTIPKGLGTGA